MSPSRRRLLACLAWSSGPAHALMAGALPDTAAARLDPNDASSPWTSAVGVLVNGNLFSGVVVSPTHVLTAAHVTGATLPAAVSVQVNSTQLPVVIGAKTIAIFPTASFPYDDLALITLAEPVPPDVEVLPIYRQIPPARQVLTLVGHGWSGQGDVGPSVAKSPAVKRTGRNTIDAVQTTLDASSRSSLFYLMDFDGPTGAGAFGSGTLGNAVETGLASGDSGSPAYATIGGQRWLVGINNFTGARPGTTVVDFKFGTLAGGLLLSDARFIDWLTIQTAGTLGLSSPALGDVPLPGWALGLLACGLAGAALRRRGSDG